MARAAPPRIPLDAVRRLWLQRQGLAVPRGSVRLTRRAFVQHLESAGALQVDTIQVLERAHYLTLWSRFGAYRKPTVDRWIYRDRAAYEYWGHEASILPASHLAVSLRRMRSFPPAAWKNYSWWPHYATSPGSKRRVLGRLRREGPLESSDFERRASDTRDDRPDLGTLPKEDKRSLQFLWHAGKVAVADRRSGRRLWDLAERVHPATGDSPTEPVSKAAFEESWLRTGLRGNGVAPEAHLAGYWTAAKLTAADRRRVIQRALARGEIVEVAVEDRPGTWYATPRTLDELESAPEPRGTHLICPFDSLLWQRKRAEELLGFRYRVEIYVPPAKREFGYYVLPILHDGAFVGRLDPKLHREHAELEIKGIWLEAGFRRSARFDRELGESLKDLAKFVGAEEIKLPRGWGKLV